MESPRLRLLPLLGAALLLLLPLLGTLAQEDAELQPRALDIYSAVEDASHEKQLVWLEESTGAGRTAKAATWGSAGAVLQIEALQEVLKKLKSKRIPIYEKKYGQVPMGVANNSDNGFAAFCWLPFVSTISPCPLVSKVKE
ncbi:Cocaine- and amphetamine-regulated transcript protein, partial [Eschrichtius robustus]|nr:Cocaine- and amphetamine-regulated transcript protein [Eschrichtius robustus]